MAYRPHPKGARTNPSSPRAWGTDDRTGFVNNLCDLRWQYEWAGNQLINKRLLVRQQSLDKPNPQFRTLVLPPDPSPLMNARPEPYSIDEAGPVQTTLSQTANEGDVLLYVASVSGFANGNNIFVQIALGFAEATIASLNSIANTITLTAPLTDSAHINGTVTLAIS